VKDVVDAVLWFFEHQDKKGIYNLGTGHAQTWNELAESIFSALNKPAVIEYIEMPDSIRNQYQYFTESDMTKLRAAGCPTSFRPLQEGVSDYISNYLINSRTLRNSA
jgi:ADP-L-glycero-D-manno-heptose 6-epimerase